MDTCVEGDQLQVFMSMTGRLTVYVFLWRWMCAFFVYDISLGAMIIVQWKKGGFMPKELFAIFMKLRKSLLQPYAKI